MNHTRRDGDVTHQYGGLALCYGLPVAILMLSPNWIDPGPARAIIWSIAFGVMGLRCLLNARSCGRVHCYFTGPWFLAGAAGALALGFIEWTLPVEPWPLLANLTCLGALVVFWVSERVFGRYFNTASSPAEAGSP